MTSQSHSKAQRTYTIKPREGGGIACLGFNLQKTKVQLGVQVLVTDPRELEKIRYITKERIEKILKAGANVVLTTKGIDDMSLKVCFIQVETFFYYLNIIY